MQRRQFLRLAGMGSALAAGGFATLHSSRGRAQGAVQKVTLMQAGPELAFAGIFLATKRQLWQEEGLDVTVKRVTGGPLALTALTTGDAQFSTLASSDVLIAIDKQIPIVAIAAVTTRLVLGLAARNDWMAAKGLTPASPLDARVKALKGARIGVATVGGGPAQYGRFLLHAHGLDGQRDAQFLPVGQSATRVAALRENRVDVIICAAPEAELTEQQGYGTLLINLANDVPAFRDYAFTVVITTREIAEKNADLVRRMARVVGRGNSLVHSDFALAVQVAQESHAAVDPAAVALAMRRIKDGSPNGAAMTQSMWKNVVDSMRTTGAIARDPPTEDGVMWTNRYLG